MSDAFKGFDLYSEQYTTVDITDGEGVQDLIKTQTDRLSKYDGDANPSIARFVSAGIKRSSAIHASRLNRRIDLTNSCYVDPYGDFCIYNPTYDKKHDALVFKNPMSYQPLQLVDLLLIDFKARLIDDGVSFLAYPFWDPRCDGKYLQGMDNLRIVLDRLYFTDPQTDRDMNVVNLTEPTLKTIYKSLTAALRGDKSLRFKSNDMVFTTADGSIFLVNVDATDRDDVITKLDRISPDDNVLDGTEIPVTYDPTITSNEYVDRALRDWSNGNEPRAKRIVQAYFSTTLVKGLPKKGFVFSYSRQGGSGKSLCGEVAMEFLGGPSRVYFDSLNTLGGDFNGVLAQYRAVIDDEMIPTAISNDAMRLIKSVVTGQVTTGQLKHQNERATIYGLNVIAQSNHFFIASQRETSLGAWKRRFNVIHWERIFDTGDDATSCVDPALKGHLLEPESMSYLLNLALEGLKDYVVAKCEYIKVPDDDALAEQMIGATDTVASFLAERGGVYGADWSMPRIVPFGKGGRKSALVIPLHLWRDLSEGKNINSMWIYDMRTCETKQYFSRTTDYVGFANDYSIIYGEYEGWHDSLGNGDKGCLSSKAFAERLGDLGYSNTLQVRTPFGDRKRFVAPVAVVDTKTFGTLIDEQIIEHEQHLNKSNDDAVDEVTLESSSATRAIVDLADQIKPNLPDHLFAPLSYDHNLYQPTKREQLLDGLTTEQQLALMALGLQVINNVDSIATDAHFKREKRGE